MSRTVGEWVGKHDNQPIPARVKLRVFDRYRGRCYLSGIKILPGMAWEIEHVIALAAGGQHRESNFAPALKEYHKEKTRKDRKTIAKINKVRLKHAGLKKPKGRPLIGTKASGWKRKMDGTLVRR